MHNWSVVREWEMAFKYHSQLRENSVFVGKQKPTAGQTTTTIAMEQRSIDIDIPRCERG